MRRTWAAWGSPAAVAIMIAGFAGVVSAWFDWTISGSARRDSYASLRAAQRLGIEELTPYRVAWFLVPVAVLAIAALLIAQADRTAGLLGVVTGLVLVGFGVGVLMTPVAAGFGPWLSCIAGLSAVGASVALIAQGRGQS